MPNYSLKAVLSSSKSWLSEITFILLALFFTIVYTPDALAELKKIGERGQYDVFIERSTIIKSSANIEFTMVYIFNNYFEFVKDDFYNHISVKYVLNCNTLNYEQEVLEIYNSKNGKSVSGNHAKAFKFSIPKSKLDQFFNNVCKI
jgi:hypothetical protein